MKHPYSFCTHFRTFLFTSLWMVFCYEGVSGIGILPGNGMISRLEVRVQDSSGNPLPGATLQIKGSGKGTQTNDSGLGILTDVPDQAILMIRYVGYFSQEITLHGQSSLTVTLQQNARTTREIVVTALGIRREKRSLGYATQDISGIQLTKADNPNLIGALQGKIAGLQVTKSSAGPGSSSNVVLRGYKSLTGGGADPLYVIDGIPIGNNISSQPGEFNGRDSGDGITNINPDDVESINVLKGPSAAALYGYIAANGAIIITTKKGNSVAKGLGISYNAGYSVENPLLTPKIQQQFSQGDGGKYSPTSDNSWGAQISGQSVKDYAGRSFTLQPSTYSKKFFQTGTTMNHNLSISGGDQKNQYYVTVNYLRNDGILPNNYLESFHGTARINAKIGDQLFLDTKLTYLTQNVSNRYGSGEESTNPYSGILRVPQGYDITQLTDYAPLDAQNSPTYNYYTGGNVSTNPYWIVNKFKNSQTRNRILGLTSLTYQINEHLSLAGRVGVDLYDDNTSARTAARTPVQLVSGSSSSGDYSSGQNRFLQINADVLLSYKTALTTNWNLSLTGGANYRRQKTDGSSQSSGGLVLPNIFTLDNGIAPKSSGPFSSELEVQSIYGLGQLAYHNYLYLDVTGRNDWSSTLNATNRSFFYPSVSLSAIISDMLSIKPDYLTFAKVRASYAVVGAATSPYRTGSTLVVSPGVGTVAVNNPATQPFNDLKPESTRNLEFGADLRFLDDRIGLDFSYYTANTLNQFITLPVPASSGFIAKSINAGNVQNSGFEVVLGLTPVKQKTFRWDLTLNYSKNKNKIIELYKDPQTGTKVSEIIFGQSRIATIKGVEGAPIGDLYVKGFKRDPQGNVLIDSTGLPGIASNPVLVGRVTPNWLGSVRNEFTYGPWQLSVLLDGRFGGVIASHSQAVLAGLGLSESTLAGRNGDLVVSGFTAGGSANAKNISAEKYWTTIGGRGAPVGEAFVYDATTVRVREFSLGYTFPSVIKGIQSLSLAVTGRNLLFITNHAPFDPESALNNGVGGQGVDFWSLPSTRSFGLDIRIKL